MKAATDLTQHASTRGSQARTVAESICDLGCKIFSTEISGYSTRQSVLFSVSPDGRKAVIILAARKGGHPFVYGRYVNLYRIGYQSSSSSTSIKNALDRGPCHTIGPYIGEGWVSNMVWDTLNLVAECRAEWGE